MTIDELARIVRLYGGTLHGSCGDWMDIEFPSSRHAVHFVRYMKWEGAVRFCDSLARIAGDVIVQVPEHIRKQSDHDAAEKE